MLYLDTSYNLKFDSGANFTFSAQAATEGGQGSNALNDPNNTWSPYGAIGSNLLCFEFAFDYKMVLLPFGFDSVFGSGSYGNGYQLSIRRNGRKSFGR